MYDTITGKTCSFNNGGCSHHAECLEVEGTTSCHCKLGYIGDGFSCDNPCDVNNGGCHENATCVFQVKTKDRFTITFYWVIIIMFEDNI